MIVAACMHKLKFWQPSMWTHSTKMTLIFIKHQCHQQTFLASRDLLETFCHLVDITITHLEVIYRYHQNINTMSMSLVIVASVTIVLLMIAPQGASAFAFFAPPARFGAVSSHLTAAMSDDDFEPFFVMQQIPTATTGAKLDRFVECAQNDGCDVQEMMDMIEGTKHGKANAVGIPQ